MLLSIFSIYAYWLAVLDLIFPYIFLYFAVMHQYIKANSLYFLDNDKLNYDSDSFFMWFKYYLPFRGY